MRRLITLVAILFAGGTARATDSSSADTTTAPAIIGNTSTAIYSMPTTCEKDGRTYREGETWNRGHLRYKCAKYGVYSIEGCRTDKDRELQIGESFVDENVVHQCYTRDGAVYYRQAVCGIYGQPACEDMKDPTKFMMPTAPTQVRTVNIPQNPASGLPQLAGLPEGWRIVDKNGNPIPISDIRITTHTVYLPANPQGGRRKRHILFGSSVPASGVNSRGQNNDGEGSDSSSTANGENKSTVERRMAATHSNTESGSRSDAEWRRKAIGLKAGDIEDRPEAFISGISKTDTFVDPAGATLRSWRIRRQVGVGSFVPVGVDDPRDNRKHAPPSGGSAGTSMGGGRVAGVGTGSVDLHHRSKTISVNTTGLRPGSIGGSQSSTAWKGRTLHIGGKEVAVGPGTFTFGTSPTGAFVRPAGGHHALRRVRRQMGVGSFVPIGVDDPRDNRKHMPLGGSGSSMSVSDRKVAGVGTGSVDLHHRSKTVSANMTSLRPESISGNRSDTAWKGRTLHIGGKEVAVGPGTFTFGTSPTGAFVRPAGGHHALRRVRRQTGVGSFVAVGVDGSHDNRKLPGASASRTPTSGGKVAGVGTGSMDLHHRSKTISANTTGQRPGTVGGSRSDTQWKGKTVQAHGRELAVGPGTFSFGSSPTGAAVHRAGGHVSNRRNANVPGGADNISPVVTLLHGFERHTRRRRRVGSFMPVGVGDNDYGDNRKQMLLGRDGSSKSVRDGKVAGVVTGSHDLHHRSKTVSLKTTGLKTESMGGSRSDITWRSQTVRVDGEDVAAGFGTHNFSASPIGPFVRHGLELRHQHEAA